MLQEEVFSIAGQYLRKMHRVGSDNVSAICPFHRKRDGSEERSPSFSMSLTKGVWHCWSCQLSGTFQSFLHDVGISRIVVTNQYGELLDALRHNHGPTFDPLRPNVVSEDPLPESMLGLFDKCPLYMVEPEYSVLLDPDDPIVFEESLLREYDVGFDEMHSRITFPLRDLDGGLVGISGRTVNNGFPRYKVYDDEFKALGYPPHSAANKGVLLWNAHRVYPATFFGASDQFVLVVEGFRGCLWAIQCGIRNTIALLGSSLSKQQLWILEHLGCRVYIMLDNDDAGRRALRGYEKEGQKRPGIAERLSRSLDVSIVEYPGKQPTKLTQEELCASVNNAVDYYTWVNKKETRDGIVR
jgi:DNA primase